jgi:ribulose-5-phosphate 4-epimerase/fuculose-1-phosphate aldolase
MLTQSISQAHPFAQPSEEHVPTPSNAESKPIIDAKYIAAEKPKSAYQAGVTKEERDAELRSGKATDRPLDVFTYGAHPVAGNQVLPIKQVRIPTFDDLLHEREFRKLHHAAALRWLGMNGYNNEGIGGHVTVRDPIKPDHFWINPHAKSFRHIKPEDLCFVNEDGVVQPEGNMHAINPAGFSIHLAVHKARPDVIAAVHCHSIPTRAFAALGCELEPINQDACRFYQDHGVYTNYGGIVFNNDEGNRIAAALGKKKAVILQGHGILTVAKTVDAAVYLFGSMDRCMEAQLMADAAAAGRGQKTIKVSHEEAVYSRRAYTDEMEFNRFQSW